MHYHNNHSNKECVSHVWTHQQFWIKSKNCSYIILKVENRCNHPVEWSKLEFDFLLIITSLFLWETWIECCKFMLDKFMHTYWIIIVFFDMVFLFSKSLILIMLEIYSKNENLLNNFKKNLIKEITDNNGNLINFKMVYLFSP